VRDTHWGTRGGGALLTLGLLLLLAGCSPLYVLRAGYEEAKILSRREPIARLVADSTTPPQTRAKLALVVQARDFARDSLRLDAGKSYTTFSQLDSDTLALVLSAARKDAFKAHTWWFPIVGHVPYKGFFSERKARRAAEALERKGFDTYVRPTSAFSTLGWFNDPLVSPLLRYDSVSLANTVIHELLHNTFYASGQAMFNESFAQFVGSRGAIALFCGPSLPDPARCERARGDWEDERLFGRFLSALVAELEALYGRSELATEEKLRLREEVFARARERYAAEVHPRLKVNSYASFTRGQLNNATLIGRRLYYGRLDLFEQLFQQSGGDLRRTIERVREAVRGVEDPYAALEALVTRPTSAAMPPQPL
jgi:predicted aminopeptidase